MGGLLRGTAVSILSQWGPTVSDFKSSSHRVIFEIDSRMSSVNSGYSHGRQNYMTLKVILTRLKVFFSSPLSI